MTGPAYDLVTRRLAEVTGYQPPNARATWRCPAHDDRNPSLTVSNGDGRVLMCCQARQCTIEDITAALDLKLGDLFDEPLERPTANARPTIEATYPYVDEAGDLLFEVVRMRPKLFRQRTPDGKGGWVWRIGAARRVLYRLPQVLEAVQAGGTIWVVEGEKDVEALERAGQVATCNAGGAGKWRPEYTEALTGAAEVIIVRDKDPAGLKHAADVEASLTGKVRRIHVVEAATGKDAADHLGAGHTVDDFEVAEEASAPASGETSAFFVDWSKFWARDRRDADWLYDEILARGRGHSIYAGHKTGKSLLALWVVAQLIRLLDVVVIYLDYEMGEDDLYDRLADMGHGPESDLTRLYYALLPSLPPLDTPEGAAALLAHVDTVQAANEGRHVAVIIDTTGRAVAGEENSADTYRNFYRWTGIGLKQRGNTWARLDHAGKDANKGQRGSSAKGDDVDVVWKLTRTANGLELSRNASRMGWVPEKVTFRQVQDPHLRFVKVGADWPAGTKEIAAILDDLGVPLDAGERPAGNLFRQAGHTASQSLLRAAVRWRRSLADETST